MAAMTTLRDILNNTPGNAVDVEFNFNTVESYIATGVIKTDGTNAMTAALSLVAGNPVNPTDAAHKGYVDQILPTGVTVDYLGTAAPSAGWLVCDGTVVSQASYPALFALLGATYNTGGEGGTQFRLPDFRRRVSVGYDSVTAPFNALGVASSGGSADAVIGTHTHTGPSHQHTTFHTHTYSGTSSNHSADHTHTFTSGIESQNHVHSGAGNGFVYWSTVYGSGSGSQGEAGSVWALSWIPNTAGNNVNHTHSGTTAGASNNHTHTYSGTTLTQSDSTTSASGTQNTGSAGEAVTNKNYPPYVVVTKIVKT